MQVLWTVLVLVFMMCFFVYQWWFEQSRVRNMTQKRRAKVKWYNKPAFWMVLTIATFLALIAILSVQLAGLTEALMELNNE